MCRRSWQQSSQSSLGRLEQLQMPPCRIPSRNPFRDNVCQGVQNLENMQQRCLEAELCPFLISGSFAAPRITVKTIKQRLWPYAGVDGRLAARGLFAARLLLLIAAWASTFGLFNPFRC